jgi:hypothetical protein
MKIIQFPLSLCVPSHPTDTTHSWVSWRTSKRKSSDKVAALISRGRRHFSSPSARNGYLELPVYFLKAKQGHTARKKRGKYKRISYIGLLISAGKKLGIKGSSGMLYRHILALSIPEWEFQIRNWHSKNKICLCHPSPHKKKLYNLHRSIRWFHNTLQQCMNVWRLYGFFTCGDGQRNSYCSYSH